MKIISIDEISEDFNKEVDFLRIDLNSENIGKVPFLILYNKEHGYKNFVLNYDFTSLDLNFKKLFFKIKIENIFEMIDMHNLKIGFTGIPQCIFQKYVLKPKNRWKYENNVLYIEKFDCNNGLLKEFSCEDCMNNSSCFGFCKNYFDAYSSEEFSPLVRNIEFEKLYLDEINKFKSEAVKFYAHKALEDFVKDDYFMRRKFIFLKSYPKDEPSNFADKFIYQIFNRKDDFENTYNFLLDFFDEIFLFTIKRYLFESSKIVMTLGISNDNILKKTIYISLDQISELKRKEFFNFFNIKTQGDNVSNIGFDFREDIVGYKVCYKEDNVSGIDMKRFVLDVGLESKKNLMRFSNSLTKSLNNVLFDYKYRDGVLISKRVNISLEDNNFRLNQLSLLFSIPMAFYDDKELLNLGFEMCNGEVEKINLYYSLILPELEERDYKFND